MAEKPKPNRIEVPVKDGKDADEVKEEILQKYIDAHNEYRKLNAGRPLYDITITEEEDDVLGTVPVIAVSRNTFDDAQGWHFERLHEIVLVDSTGRRVRTERQITSDVHRVRQFKHDKMQEYWTNKKQFVATDLRIHKLKREKFVNPDNEAEAAAKIASRLRSEYDAQDSAVDAVTQDG